MTFRAGELVNCLDVFTPTRYTRQFVTDVSTSRRKLLLFQIVSVVLALGAAIVLMEIVLRLTGTVPVKIRPERDPLFRAIEQHSTLGWQNREGRFPFVNADPRFTGHAAASIDHRRSRVCVAPPEGDPRFNPIWVLGGSFAFGWAVDDSQVFSCQLQRELDTPVTNFAVAGFGTFQSLLLLRNHLKADQTRHVIYGFYGHHEDRNVATGSWRYSLNVYQGKVDVRVPYATISANRETLIHHEPLGQMALPFRRWLATSVLLERVIMRWRDQDRIRNKREITFRIVEEIKQVSHAAGADFTFVVLNADVGTRSAYSTFTASNDIDFADCHQKLTPHNTVPIDGHPDGSVHRAWAQCVERHLTAPHGNTP